MDTQNSEEFVVTRVGYFKHGYPNDLRWEAPPSPTMVYDMSGHLLRVIPGILANDNLPDKYADKRSRGGKIAQQRRRG